MKNNKNKDELIKLLKEGSFDRFNELRSVDKDSVIDLTEINLSECAISKVNFSLADLSGSDFSECEINGVDFSNSDLTSAAFTGANIKQCDFAKTVLEEARFNNSEVNKCDFTESNLSGVDFSGANLGGSDFALSLNIYQCKFDSYTQWPDDENLPEDFDPTEEPGLVEDAEDFYEDDFAY